MKPRHCAQLTLQKISFSVYKVLLFISGATPLHYAVEEGHADIVKILLDNGAIVNSRNKQGLTPLVFPSQVRSVWMHPCFYPGREADQPIWAERPTFENKRAPFECSQPTIMQKETRLQTKTKEQNRSFVFAEQQRFAASPVDAVRSRPGNPGWAGLDAAAFRQSNWLSQIRAGADKLRQWCQQEGKPRRDGPLFGCRARKRFYCPRAAQPRSGLKRTDRHWAICPASGCRERTQQCGWVFGGKRRWLEPDKSMAEHPTSCQCGKRPRSCRWNSAKSWSFQKASKLCRQEAQGYCQEQAHAANTTFFQIALTSLSACFFHWLELDFAQLITIFIETKLLRKKYATYHLARLTFLHATMRQFLWWIPQWPFQSREGFLLEGNDALSLLQFFDWANFFDEFHNGPSNLVRAFFLKEMMPFHCYSFLIGPFSCCNLQELRIRSRTSFYEELW